MSGWAASTIRNPVRSSTWSSTSITRIVIGASSVSVFTTCFTTCRGVTGVNRGRASASVRRFEREQDTDTEPSPRTRARVECAADHADPLAHADQAVALTVGAALLVQLVRGALAVVLDEQAQPVV